MVVAMTARSLHGVQLAEPDLAAPRLARSVGFGRR